VVAILVFIVTVALGYYMYYLIEKGDESIGADWVFVCRKCLLSVKKKNPHYKFGGTWKR